MNIDDQENLRCSFCGKAQSEIERLIAGPGSYICNECVAICNEILESKPLDPARGAARAQRLLGSARTDLKAARLLIEQGYYRMAVVAARSAATVALELICVGLREHSPLAGDFKALFDHALRQSEELRRLDGLGGWRLLSEYAFDDEVDVARATQAIDTVEDILEFIESSQDAT